MGYNDENKTKICENASYIRVKINWSLVVFWLYFGGSTTLLQRFLESTFLRCYNVNLRCHNQKATLSQRCIVCWGMNPICLDDYSWLSAHCFFYYFLTYHLSQYFEYVLEAYSNC